MSGSSLRGPVLPAAWGLVRSLASVGSALPALAVGTARHGPTLVTAVLAHAQRRPGRVAWVDDEGALSYRQLAHEVVALAAASPADLVVQLGDQRRLMLTVLAALHAGSRQRVVGARSGTDVLDAVLERNPEAALVTDGAVERAPLAAAARPPDPARPPVPLRGSGHLMAFTTSGSTGSPKLVPVGYGVGATSQSLALVGVLPVPRRPVVACLAPVDHGHGFGLLAGTLALGGTFVSLPRTPRRAVEVLHRAPTEVHLLSGVPRQLADLLDEGLSRAGGAAGIGAVLSGSDVLGADLERRLTRLAPVWNAYGATETGTVSVASPAHRRRSPGTVGSPLTGVRVRVLDDEGQPLPLGAEGLLEVHSPLGGPEPFTGDRGRVDRHDLLHVTGRADGLLVSGGENVDPQVLRDWLLRQPGVLGAQVRLVPEVRFGRRLAARVTVDPHHRVDVAELRAAARAVLGPAAAPWRIDLLD